MNKYNMDYDSHSLFLRFKSNERYKERIGSIKKRKNLFLPEIKDTNRLKVDKEKHTSVVDLERSYEINSNNRRLLERLGKIKSKSNNLAVLKTESSLYSKHVDHQKIYNTIQRQIALNRIKADNQRLNLRILKR